MDSARCINTALLQLNVDKDLNKNLENAERYICEAKENNADLIILSECFNSPYGIEFFNEYAETIPDGPTSRMLSKAANDYSIFLVGGTFPEREGSKLYNTCTVWNSSGELIAKFRKMHLFDIDIPGDTFRESDVLQPGNELITFDMNGVKIGLGICHDLRFEEMAKLYRLQNCEVLIYPAAFNMFTGSLHFELLQRARALDNQVFVLVASPARGQDGYITWGHSQVTNPCGNVVAQAGYEQEILYYTMELNQCNEAQQKFPIFYKRRNDIYNTILLEK